MSFSDIIKKQKNRPKPNLTDQKQTKAKQTLDNKCHTCYQNGRLLTKADVFLKTYCFF